NPYQVLTGSAQTSLVWLKLYQYTSNIGSPDSRYLNAAIAMNQYLIGRQGVSTNKGINGGLAGSDPIDTGYMANKILSWATKFFLDALNLQLALVPPATVPAIDLNKWSFPLGPTGFSNIGGTLQYDGLSNVFGRRAIAKQNNANFVFSDGVIDYDVQSNGGF